MARSRSSGANDKIQTSLNTLMSTSCSIPQESSLNSHRISHCRSERAVSQVADRSRRASSKLWYLSAQPRSWAHAASYRIPKRVRMAKKKTTWATPARRIKHARSLRSDSTSPSTRNKALNKPCKHSQRRTKSQLLQSKYSRNRKEMGTRCEGWILQTISLFYFNEFNHINYIII